MDGQIYQISNEINIISIITKNGIEYKCCEI